MAGRGVSFGWGVRVSEFDSSGANNRSRRRRWLLGLLTLGLTCIAMLALGEVMVRLFSPQSVMFPRYRYSERYNTSLYPDTRIVHEKPGHYRYVYTVNQAGFRGPCVDPDSKTDKIVVLGDSYSMGVGVDDGEEYPAHLRKLLEDEYDVVNLGVGGWGLTQQVRAFEEFGVPHDPGVVILQFSANDPTDSMLSPVARWNGSVFEFHDLEGSVKSINRYLARSPIQKSQLYNFVRNRLWTLWRSRSAAGAGAEDERSLAGASAASRPERLYVTLLEPFARLLHERGVELVMISVTGQLEEFPIIEAKVRELDRSGLLHYVDVNPWFDGVTGYASPQGHAWGTLGHEIVGMHLAQWIRKGLSSANMH